MCEGLIKESEAKRAIFDMKLNKSPGSDGLTVEFYRKNWNLLSKLIKRKFSKGELSVSQKQDILSLLYKKSDPENLDNWRPISLLNIDYKILAHVLAKRLQVILPIIISNDQQGFIKNRFIGFNIRLIQDVIDFINLFDTEGILLFLDFKKAIDTVEWSFMFKGLKKFGYKDSFIRWTRIMYDNITSIVANDGWLSDPFPISRGIRQGCPLSALVFVIVAEIIATKIRNSTALESIKVASENGEHYIKICQLADDTTLFLKYENEVRSSLTMTSETIQD